MFAIGIVSVAIVIVGHCNQKEPYIDSKRIRKVYKKRPAPSEQPTPAPTK